MESFPGLNLSMVSLVIKAMLGVSRFYYERQKYLVQVMLGSARPEHSHGNLH